MPELSSSDLLEVLSALANPHRLQILAALANETNYVSQLAREIGISRPLLIMHLKRLEEAGLVTSKLELSNDGKAMRYYEIGQFDLRLTPEAIAGLAKTSGPFVAS
ncbi:MAG TPA: winged helix-turn-helix domain-containing protein [Anaerolineales bacterium]|nr:winged helix-turn-helix domain-containing protein [Anaerolineales bacterium]